MGDIEIRDRHWRALFAAFGIGIFAMLRLHPEGANEPDFVVDAAAGTFVFADLSVIARALNQPLLGRLAGLMVVYLLAGPGLWCLLADDAGSCSVGMALCGAGATSAANPTLCRTVFGAGGFLVLAVAVLFTVQALRSKRQKPSD